MQSMTTRFLDCNDIHVTSYQAQGRFWAHLAIGSWCEYLGSSIMDLYSYTINVHTG